MIINNIFSRISDKIEISLYKYRWRKKNGHNYTSAGNRFKLNNVNVGKGTYGLISVVDFGSNPNLMLTIGNYCSIADNVYFLLAAEHNYKTFSTYPFSVKVLKNTEYEAQSKGNILICDDVWIGQGALIMSGITIGQGAIVAAGSIVTKNVPDYAIVAGVPATVIKYRFNKLEIEKMKLIDYSRIDDVLIQKYSSYVEKSIDNTFFSSAFYKELIDHNTGFMEAETTDNT